MRLKSKKAILIEYFQSSKIANKFWYEAPIQKLEGKSPKDILTDKEAAQTLIDFLFTGMVSGVFENPK